MTIAPARRCEFCGYDLRGITSVECPECGQAKTVSLRFDDHEHYHRARAALEHAELLVSFVNAGLAGEIVYASAKTAGWLRVSSTNYDRAADILNDIGVRWIEEQRVFVDRTEPTCPRCKAELTDVDADVCRACGVGLQWMERPDTLGTDDDVVCPQCFRDVKLMNGRGPECDGAIAGFDSNDDDSLSAAIASRDAQHQSVALWFCLMMAFTIPIFLLIGVLYRLFNANAGFWSALTAIPIAAVIAYMVVRRRSS